MMYIVCEDMNFSVDETFLLAMDRARAGAIKKREGGIYGSAS